MQIKVSLQIFIFIIIFYLTKQIEVYAILMLLAFLHECGHLLAGLLLKLKPKKLEINPFGVAIIFEKFGSKDNKFEMKKMLISNHVDFSRKDGPCGKINFNGTMF